MKAIAAFFLLLALTTGSLAQAPQSDRQQFVRVEAPLIALTHVRVIDGTGAAPMEDQTIMISDGNAAVTDEDHNASLCAFYLTFGDVMSTDAVIACLEQNARKSLSAAE